MADVNLSSVGNLAEAELEDLYDKECYREAFLAQYGVDPKQRDRSARNKKWSKVMEILFRRSGKPWSSETKTEVKWWLARFAAEHAGEILHPKLSQPLDSFIEMAERKLASAQDGG